MTTQSVCQFRIDPKEKAEAFAVIESYGFTPSQVMRLFLREVKQTKSIPFAIKTTNQETLKAMEDAKNGHNLVFCKDEKDLFSKLGI